MRAQRASAELESRRRRYGAVELRTGTLGEAADADIDASAGSPAGGRGSVAVVDMAAAARREAAEAAGVGEDKVLALLATDGRIDPTDI